MMSPRQGGNTSKGGSKPQADKPPKGGSKGTPQPKDDKKGGK